MVLLHGFPEFWYSYREQIPVLAQHFKVVAPDMRGYNLSSKPAHIKDYVVPELIEDVVQLIHSFGEEQAHIVGHDWGGVVAWMTALNSSRGHQEFDGVEHAASTAFQPKHPYKPTPTTAKLVYRAFSSCPGYQNL